MPLTPLRTAGLLVALVFAVLTIRSYRNGRIGNGDLMLRIVVFVLPLLVLSVDAERDRLGLRRVLVQARRRPPGAGRHACSRSASCTCSRSPCRAARSGRGAT